MYFYQLSRLTLKISSLLWQFFWSRECTNIFSRRTRATFHELCRILSFLLSKEKAFSNEQRFFNWLFEKKRHLRHSTRRLFWWTFEERRLFIFQEYVQVFIEIDEKLQQLKYRQSRFVVSIIAFHFSKLKFFIVFNVDFLNIKFVVSIFIVVVTSIISFVINNFMNLNFAMTIVQNKTLFISKMKKICNKWKLCYYCKIQHSSKIVKKCLNKKFFNFRLVDLNDNVNIDENISLFARKV